VSACGSDRAGDGEGEGGDQGVGQRPVRYPHLCSFSTDRDAVFEVEVWIGARAGEGQAQDLRRGETRGRSHGQGQGRNPKENSLKQKRPLQRGLNLKFSIFPPICLTINTPLMKEAACHLPPQKLLPDKHP